MLSHDSIGKVVAVSVFVLVISSTIMLQNPLDPIFSGLWGKLQVTEIFFIISLIAFIYFRVFRFKKILTKYFLMIVGFLITTFIVSNWYTILNLYLFCLFGIIVFADIEKRGVDKICSLIFSFNVVLCILTLMSCVYSFILEHDTQFSEVRTGFPYIGQVVRAIGPFEPTAKLLSYYLLLMLPINVSILEKSKSKYFKVSVTSLFIIISVLTLGRSGALTAIAYFAYLLACVTRDHGKNLQITIKSVYIMMVIIFVLFLTVLTVIHVDIDQKFCVPSDPNGSQYYGTYKNTVNLCINIEIYKNTYYILKEIAWESYLNHNVLWGGGRSSFFDTYIQVRENSLLSDNYEYLDFYLPQSTPLLLMAEHGSIGAILWISWWFTCIHSVRKSFLRTSNFVYLIFVMCNVITIIDLDVNNFRFVYLILGIYVLTSTNDKRIDNDYR